MQEYNPIRILQVVGTMDFGGAETLIMNIYRNIDKSKVQFDFLCHNRIECKYADEIYKLGGKIYKVDGIKKAGLFDYLKQLKLFFKTHKEYNVIHAHNSIDNGIVLWQAKKQKIPCRISHSHNTIYRYNTKNPLIYWYKLLSKRLNNKSATHRFACSNEAGIALFGKNNFQLFYNAIDVKNFQYDIKKREDIRAKLFIKKDEILIGHVGRFAVEKNHKFLIDIFAEYLKIYQKGKLILIGAGPLENEIKQKVSELGITERVIFPGLVSNTYDYYSAMDVFLFPSINEGLPVSLVEAQASGLPVIMSNRISPEIIITDNVKELPLEASKKLWVDEIYKSILNSKQRDSYADCLLKTSFNINTYVIELQSIYLNLYKR